MKKILFAIIFFFLFSLLIYSQWKIKEASAVKADETIVVDGLLKEAIWQKAPPVSNFIQFEPQRGEPASVETIVRVLYDQRYIYFGFLCYDPQPERIAARITKRDAKLNEDDSVSVLLDTFHDRRTCYFFMTNILGTQYDGRISDNGRTVDTTWDGIWKSAGQRTNFGWSAEIAIDLTSLKYKPGENKTWGLNLARVVPRQFEASLWTGPPGVSL